MAIDETAVAPPPVPEVNDLNRFYWEAARQHRLELLRCRRCGHFVHYPRPVCDRCQSTDLGPEEVSGRGVLYSFCTLMQADHPYFAERIPYTIGVVDIVEETGVRVPTGLVDHEGVQLRCGIPVEVVFRELTPDVTLPYFRPVRDHQGASK